MFSYRPTLIAALLASSALVPVTAVAQDAPAEQTETTAEPVDRIVVRYRYIPEERRTTSEVSAVLSLDDLETTGDADLASALVRITGLSTTGGRFVVVRGLNERYSNTLLNGSPMPSPEPFRRAAPLDILPTSVLSDVLVQKTFSPEFPGEFGGGVIAIETASLPNEGFLSVGFGTDIDVETSLRPSLTYDGSDTDWLGMDDGLRDLPSPLANIFYTTRVGNNLPADQQQAIGRSLVNSELWVVQQIEETPLNGSGQISMGDRYEFDGFSLGVLLSGQYDNSWVNRNGVRGKGAIGNGGALIYENGPANPTLDAAATPDQIQDNVRSSENIVELSGLFSVGVEWGDAHEISYLGMVLRSTSKETRIQQEYNAGSNGVFRSDATEWFERQVVFNQIRGEHVFDSLGGLEMAWRVSDASGQREAPYQREAVYEVTPAGTFYNGSINDNVTRFSEIEDSTSDWGVDFELPLNLGGQDFIIEAGYSDTSRSRDAWSRRFSFEPGSIGLPADLLTSRIDYIFAPQNIVDSRLRLVETGGLTLPEAYRGELDVQAFYAGIDWQLTNFVRAAVGARMEDGEQSVNTFAFPANPNDTGVIETQLQEDYVLPSVTLTWTFADNLQLRTGYAQTVTRPQFRELAFSEFFNTDTDQRFQGNPYLVNSEITNWDARLEYYFGREQFTTLGVFYKEIDNPIEEFIIPIGDGLNTSFINAPSATLTGVEFEYERTFDFSDRWDNALFQDREWFMKFNYTYIQSEVSGQGTVSVAQGAFGQPQRLDLNAAGFIQDGRALQGQSENLFNIQFGYDSNDGRSRAALLYNFTGERTRAVANLSDNLPEIIEEVPNSLDFVYNRTIEIANGDWDVRLAARNLLGDDYEAYQTDGTTTLPVDTYEVGTSMSLSVSRTW